MSTQNIEDKTMELTNPLADPRIVDKLAKWLLEKNPWAYTGHKSTRSNAKPKELWVRFHKDTEVWWFEHFRYSTEPATDAGAKGPAYRAGISQSCAPQNSSYQKSLYISNGWPGGFV